MKERFLENPNLPQGAVLHILLSEEYPPIVKALEKQGITAIAAPASERLPVPVRYHADMLCCYLGNGRMVVAAGEKILQERLTCFDVQTIFTEQPLRNYYPYDAGCNILQIGKDVFYNPKSADRKIIKELEDCILHKVSQGYSRCSVAVVNEKSAITADPGMAKAMKQAGLEVLEIQPGKIRLPGYNYGFIGGCCGLIAPDKLAFTGSLKQHPDGERIKTFLFRRGVSYVELMEEPLLDIGGLIPIKEEWET